jgi:flagellar protein FlaG
MELGRVEGTGGLAAIAPVSPLTPEQRAEQAKLIHAVEAVNQAKLFGQSSELTFSIDRHSRKPVMKIVDRETKEVIRQIPPDYVLRLAEDLETL